MAMANGGWTPSAISHQPSAISHDGLLLPHELTQHVGQDAAVAERDERLGRVDARRPVELDLRVALAERAHADRSARLQALRDAGDLVALSAGEAERGRGGPRRELQRQDAHVHEVAAVDALEA